MNVPFKQAYVPNVALVVLTLFPQLINTAVYPMLSHAIAKDLGVTQAAVLEYPLFYEGAFVFGILIGTTFIRRHNVRPVYLSMLAIDLILSISFALAHSSAQMIVLNVAAGCVGGAFLMVALPPLFTNFEPKFFHASAALMVPCLFGAATLAPIVTAPLAAASLWRPLFWGEALVLVLAFVFAIFTVGPTEPKDPDAPTDWFAIGIGAFSIACIFAGVHNAAMHEWTYLPALVPFVTGIAGSILLVAGEYRRENALLPIKRLLTSYAVIGFIGAAAGNAIYIANVQVANVVQMRVLHLSPMQIAATTWPLFAMTIVTGLLFAWILKTRWVPLYTLAGLIGITAGSALFLANLEHRQAVFAWTSLFLIGYGAGATITPGLFTVGLSLPRDIIARGIAAVEVVRLTLGFISGPLAEHTIVTHARSETAAGKLIANGNAVGHAAAANVLVGLHWTMLYVIGIGALATLAIAALLIKYYRTPHAPNVVRYVQKGEPAFDSPPLN